MTPGEYQLKDGDIELCAGRERIQLDVGNTGDRPVQIGFGSNPARLAL